MRSSQYAPTGASAPRFEKEVSEHFTLARSAPQDKQKCSMKRLMEGSHKALPPPPNAASTNQTSEEKAREELEAKVTFAHKSYLDMYEYIQPLGNFWKIL